MIIAVKKGDPPLELPTLPSVNVPSSVTELWETVKGFGKSKTSVTEPEVEGDEKKVMIDECGRKIETVGTEVTVSDSASVVSNLHEQCHCPVGNCVHTPSDPTHPVS